MDTTSGGEHRGRDNAKNVDGRKRHIVVDGMGLLLAVLVTAAQVDDAKAAPDLFARLDGQPVGKVTRMYADSKYHNYALYEWVEQNAGWSVEVVRRPAGVKGTASANYRRHETRDAGHGRIDERSYGLTPVPRDFALTAGWPTVKALGHATRLTRHADGTEAGDRRYYIASRYVSGKRFAEAVRGHRGIESMHWTLDVTFREDDSRTRERTLANNPSWLRRFAISLVKRHPVKDSLRGKLLRCGYNTDFLTEVLTLKTV